MLRHVWSLWYVAFVLGVLLLALLVALPYTQRWEAWEPPLAGAALFLVLLLGNVSLWAAWTNRNRGNAYRAVAAVILAAAVCFSASRRTNELERLGWEVHGTIEEKYKSSNHGALSLRIAGKAYEGVDPQFWHAANAGDRVDKERYSVCGRLNARRLPFVLSGLRSTLRGRLLQ